MTDNWIESTHDVFLADPGGDGVNTIVLSGLDVVVPLEADLDDDPHQDDELRLASLDGRVERVLLPSDEDVVRDGDSARFFYTFRDVPPGLYTVSVRISDGEWAPVMTGVLITTREATWQGTPLASLPPPFEAGEDLPEEGPADPEPSPAPTHVYYEYSDEDEEL